MLICVHILFTIHYWRNINNREHFNYLTNGIFFCFLPYLSKISWRSFTYRNYSFINWMVPSVPAQAQLMLDPFQTENHWHGIIYLYSIWEKLTCEWTIQHNQTELGAVCTSRSMSVLSLSSMMRCIKPAQYLPMVTSIFQGSSSESGICSLVAVSQRKQI